MESTTTIADSCFLPRKCQEGLCFAKGVPGLLPYLGGHWHRAWRPPPARVWGVWPGFTGGEWGAGVNTLGHRLGPTSCGGGPRMTAVQKGTLSPAGCSGLFTHRLRSQWHRGKRKAFCLRVTEKEGRHSPLFEGLLCLKRLPAPTERPWLRSGALRLPIIHRGLGVDSRTGTHLMTIACLLHSGVMHYNCFGDTTHLI